MSKWFHLFKKLHCTTGKKKTKKKLVYALVNIQALLTGGIMGQETGCRSTFNSTPIYQIYVISQNYYL